MGAINVKHTGSGADIALSSDGTSLLLDGTAIGGGGGGADLYAAETTGSTDPTATGTLSLAIGSGTAVSGNQAVGIGKSSTVAGFRAAAFGGDNIASQEKSLALGFGASSTGIRSAAIFGDVAATDSLALGVGTYVQATKATALGYNADVISAGTNGAAIGYNAYVAGSGATALTNSYASGEDSFAAAIGNNTSSYGATGANSVAIGYLAKATAIGSTALGRNCSANGDYSIVLGNGPVTGSTGSYSVAMAGASVSNDSSFGYGAEVVGVSGHDRSMMLGRGVKSRVKGGVHFGGYNGLGAGRNQSGIYILSLQSTDATPTALTTTNTAASTDNQVILPEDAAYVFEGTIVVRQNESGTNAGTDSAAWKVQGLIRRESTASTTVLVASTVTAISNTPSWGLALTADTTNGGLKIEATGQASRNLRWVGTIYTTEVLHPYA